MFHSFISDISIAPLQVHYYLEVLPTSALILRRSLHTEELQATTSEGLTQGFINNSHQLINYKKLFF